MTGLQSLSSGSRTALMVAGYRARATAEREPICSDPWARALAGDEGDALSRQFDASFAPMQLWIAVRTAWLDAFVRRFVRAPHGFPQVVLLGAGLDTRAARLATEGVRFFEVDHPATQAEKLARVRALDGYPTDCASYVPCDFEHDDFVDALAARGFERDTPAVILWEGVVPYLTEPAVRATLSRLASACEPRSVLAFDSIMKRMVEGRDLKPRDEETRALVASLGEPVRFGLNQPLPLLFECGFRYAQTVTFDEACLAMTGTYEREREFRFQHLTVASRTPPQDGLWW